MLWLEIVKSLTPLATPYIAFLTYKMNKQETERKRKKELADNEKDTSSSPLPPRSTRRKKCPKR